MQESMLSPSDTDTSKSDTPSVFMELIACVSSMWITPEWQEVDLMKEIYKILYHTLG